MSDAPALPQGFIAQLLPLLQGEADAFFASYKEEPLRGLRFRDGRVPLPEEHLCGPIPYARNGWYLRGNSNAGALPLHEAGAYYIQEPSAMAAATVLAPEEGDAVLDLCAAPGGKSTQLAMSAELSLLVCNEPVPSRAQVLARNIERMGIQNAMVTCAGPAQLAAAWPQRFDKVLVDAPCSGEGMFRRHPETIAEWTPEAPRRCHERQVEILREAAKLLRAGGRLVYSTCTFNDIENEGTIHAFLREHPGFRLLPIRVEGLPEASGGMLRLWPHRFHGEGHFVALLEKIDILPGEETASRCFQRQRPDKAASAAYADFSREMGIEKELNLQQGSLLYSVPEAMLPVDRMRIYRLGLHLGEMRGKIFLPNHALALALPMRKTLDITDAQAETYLHGDTLPCPESLSGFYALRLSGWQLGFGKASGGQMKNHYPKGLRR